MSLTGSNGLVSPVAGFLRQAKLTPHRPALCYEDTELSYQQLADVALRVAGALRTARVRHGDLVPVSVPRSPELVASLLGVLAAGAVYVPVGTGVEVGRSERFLAGAGIRTALVAAPATADRLGASPLLLADALAAASATDDALPELRQPAYVLFTSGSTGTPRPVIVDHRALANRLVWGQQEYPLAPTDRVLAHAWAGFDFSLWEMLAPLQVGASVVVAPAGAEADPEALADLLCRQRITAAHFVPGMLRYVLDDPSLPRASSLRYVFCGGEELFSPLAERLRELLPAVTLFNQYGPTETCIDSTAYRYHDRVGPRVPIGGPITGTVAHLLDDQLRPVADGVPGELWLGGVGLAWGYLDQPAETAERFVPDPVGPPGGRLYRTGDLVVRHASGSLEFCGRVDQQMNIRGIRIEPGEIEAQLCQHSDVRDACTFTVTGSDGGQVLAAAAATAGGVTAEALLAHLRQRLPEPFLPSRILLVDRLPRTTGGKLDRVEIAARTAVELAIAAPPAEPGTSAGANGGSGPEPDVTALISRRVASAWGEVLGTEPTGPEDDFFALGGHSLLAFQLVIRIRKQFGVKMPLRQIFEARTFGGLVAAVEERLIELVA